jgi:hypothetical protein
MERVDLRMINRRERKSTAAVDGVTLQVAGRVWRKLSI